jgi:hypothetical protein
LRKSGSVRYVPVRAVPFWTICKLLHVGHKDMIILPAKTRLDLLFFVPLNSCALLH